MSWNTLHGTSRLNPCILRTRKMQTQVVVGHVTITGAPSVNTSVWDPTVLTWSQENLQHGMYIAVHERAK